MNTSPDLTVSASLWQAVTDRLESFVTAWHKAAAPPVLDDFLPSGASPMRILTILELIKVDMEHRYRGGYPTPAVEDYAAQFPEIVEAEGISEDLIYEEFYLRRMAGLPVQAQEYIERFPRQAAQLARLLRPELPFQSTSMHPVSQVPSFTPGDRVDDFELLSLLGKGSFANVYLARQISLQRLVALKVSRCRGREPQTLAQLDHPHIVRVFDQRVIAAPHSRLLYMEYVAGGTLLEALTYVRQTPRPEWHGALLVRAVDQVLGQRGILAPHDSIQRDMLARSSWECAVTLLASQVADALEYAARQGVLHRDLKPANVLLTETVKPKLADFNVSDCRSVEGITPASYFGGSLAYMSPEQIEATNPRHPRQPDSLTVASDIYSLGVVIWELAMGERPFRDDVRPAGWTSTLDQMSQMRMAGVDATSWRLLQQVCPGPLSQIVARCLAPDPQDRFPSAGQLADELRLALEPAAFQLLRAPMRGVRAACLRWPLVCVIVIVLSPNILAGWFNYSYNFDAIVRRLPASAAATFRLVSVTINAIAFPLSLLIGIAIASPVVRAIRRRAGEEMDASHRGPPGRADSKRTAPLDPRQLQQERVACLQLGHRMAQLGIIAWTIAGIAFPLVMTIAGVPLSGTQSLHFFASLVLCGLIGASYPFFGVTALVVDVWYPALLRPAHWPTDAERTCFAWLERIGAHYFVLAGAIPLLSVSLLTMLGTTENRFFLAALSLGGLAVVAIVFLLHRRILRNLRLLAGLHRPQAREP